MFVECLARDTGLHNTIEILRMHLQHTVHILHVEADATKRRVNVALERGAGAERDHRHMMSRADAYRLLHVLGRFRE